MGETFKGDEQRMAQRNENGKLYLLTMQSEQLSKPSQLFYVPKKAEIHELKRLQYDSQQLQAMCPFDPFHVGEQISAGQFIWERLYSEIDWVHVLGVQRQQHNRILKTIMLVQPKKRANHDAIKIE